MESLRKGISGMFFSGMMVLIGTPLLAQTMTFSFDANGAATRKHVSQGGVDVERYDEFHRVIESLNYFPGGTRERLTDRYRYENNMLVEHLQYNYAEGYQRILFTFDARGNELSKKTYTSKTNGNWQELEVMEQQYDERNNRTYFNCRSMRGGSFSHIKIVTSYNYSTGMRTSTDTEYDQSGRVISSYTGKSDMGEYARNKPVNYVFDIQKDGPNMRSNRVTYWVGTDRNGNRLERTFMEHYVWSQTLDRNGRVIRIALEMSSAYENDIAIYTENESIDYTYDSQGRMIEHLSQHFKLPKEKTVYTHGRNIVAKHYRMSSNGGWLLVDTKTYNDISQFTPPKSHGKAVSSSEQQPDFSYEPSAESSTSIKSPSASKPANGQSLVNDLNGLEIESNQKEALSAFSIDAEKLAHIADVLSHATGTQVSEEQVLALAMKLLIENYNADLREMNMDYLKDKVAVFD